MLNDIAVKEVQWALQEAYKIAVHTMGITDWSDYPDYKDAKSYKFEGVEYITVYKYPNQRKIQCEEMQIEITKMILQSLHKKNE